MHQVAINAFLLNREIGECKARDVLLLARYALTELKLTKQEAAKWVAKWAAKLSNNH